MSLGILRGFTKCKLLADHTDLPIRLYSTKPTNEQIKKSTQPIYDSNQTIRKNVEGYVVTKYIGVIKNYDKILEQKFPAAMHVYRVFVVGIKELYGDMKHFMKITRIANTSTDGLRALTRRELELYYQMPKDMKKIAPVIAISALPLANYVIFPLAYLFPRQLLSHHFWSIQQRFEFNVMYLKERLKHNLAVLRFLQAKLDTLKKDDKHYDGVKHMLGLLGSGQHPKVSEILAIKEIFTKAPYELQSLPRYHLNHLCHLHGVRAWFRKRYRLAERAFVIHHMDMAIKREGGVHNMPTDSLTYACCLRGLNTTSMSNAAMVEWLEQWVEVSIAVDADNISMFLYLPILIGYNHPNNWKLLYSK